LADNEEVAIMAFPPHPTPEPAQRQAALERMKEFLDQAAANMKNAPEGEFETAANEAMDHIRRREPC